MNRPIRSLLRISDGPEEHAAGARFAEVAMWSGYTGPASSRPVGGATPWQADTDGHGPTRTYTDGHGLTRT